MALQAGDGSGVTVKTTRQREHKNMAQGGRASSMMKVARWLCSTFGIQICSRLIGSKFEGKGESSMATTVHLLDVMEAEDNLSKAGRDWVVVGKPRKGDERDAMVAADRRFRVAYAHYHNYWPDHELDAEGNVVVHGHGALYIDREKITFGGRRTAAISVVQ